MASNNLFLFNEYRKAVKKGRYHYAWLILQNLQNKARVQKSQKEYSRMYIDERGLLIEDILDTSPESFT